MYETSDCWSTDLLNFDFLGVELISQSHFAQAFSRKIFLLLYSITWSNFIVWLPLLLEIIGSMFIVIVSYPLCDVINCEIYLSFLINPFSYILPKIQSKIWNILRKVLSRWNEKHFSLLLKDIQLSEIVSNLKVHLYIKFKSGNGARIKVTQEVIVKSTACI